MYSAEYTVDDKRNLKIIIYERGGKQEIKAPVPPYFFIRTKDLSKAQLAITKLNAMGKNANVQGGKWLPVQAKYSPTGLTTLEGDDATKVAVQYPPQVVPIRSMLGDTDTFEADVPYIRRWMMDLNLRCDPVYNNVAWIDIEALDRNGFPNAEKDPILSIGVVTSDGDRHWFTISETAPVITLTREEMIVREREMLKRFWAYVRERRIQMLMAWNGDNFDFPYIVERMNVHRQDKMLQWNRLYRRPQEVRWMDLLGVHRYVHGGTRNDLDSVAQDVLKEKKRPKHGKRVSEMDPAELKDYNMWDVELMKRIDEEEGLLELMARLAQESHMFPDEVLAMRKGGQMPTPSPIIDTLVLEESKKFSYVLPTKKKKTHEKYQGAVVLDSKPGLYKNILQLDFSSLYPSTVIMWRISPEKEKEMMPGLLKRFLALKKQADQVDDKLARRAYKLVLNASYGIFGSPFYRLYRLEVASEIAARSREFFLSAVKIYTEKMGLEVILGDTDSCFVNLGNVITSDEDAKEVGQRVSKLFDEEFVAEWKDKVLSKEFVLHMDIDGFWSRIFVPTKTGGEKVKKRYAGYLMFDKHWNKIPEDKKFKVKGLELVRSDISDIAKEVQETLIKMKLDEKPEQVLEDYLREVKRRLYAGEIDRELVLRKGISKEVNMEEVREKGIDALYSTDPNADREKYYAVKTPIIKAMEQLSSADLTMVVANKYVEYIICRKERPTVVLDPDSLPPDIDYDYYWTRQVVPISERLSVRLPEADTSLDAFSEGSDSFSA